MDENTKVTFSLGIGYANANREETFTLSELGFDPEIDIDIDLDEFLEAEWKQWSSEYIDGGWEIEEE